MCRANYWGWLCSMCCKQALNSLIHRALQHAFVLAGWTGGEGGDKNRCPEGRECRAVLVSQDTRRFTRQIQTINTPFKHLHQQFLSPSAELILLQFSKSIHSPSSLSLQSSNVSASHRQEKEIKIHRQTQQQLGIKSVMNTRLQPSNFSATVKGVMG